MKIRTRYAPSPTGRMHVGNLRTALYAYLIAKHADGTFILRIEDTDQGRFVEGATEIIYRTLEETGLLHDEGPDKDKGYGPYVQSERMRAGIYMQYAKQLVEKGEAYYCFCDQARLDSLKKTVNGEVIMQYDKHCLSLPKEEVERRLAAGEPFVIRQNNPRTGTTTFHDEIYGDITVDNAELDDMVLIKSDGFPTYNFANVVDDHLMEITHVVRGQDLLVSTPRQIWIEQGFVSEAVVNFVALLGWSPEGDREIFSLEELAKVFDYSRISKSPAVFDMTKLRWMNGEYFKAMAPEEFYRRGEKYLKEYVTKPLDLKKIAEMVRTRVETFLDIREMVDFFNAVPAYETELFVNKKSKSTEDSSREILAEVLPRLEALPDWNNDTLFALLKAYGEEKGYKTGLVMWPLRIALSGKLMTPAGATEIMDVLGKEESLARLREGQKKLGSSEA